MSTPLEHIRPGLRWTMLLAMAIAGGAAPSEAARHLGLNETIAELIAERPVFSFFVFLLTCVGADRREGLCVSICNWIERLCPPVVMLKQDFLHISPLPVYDVQQGWTGPMPATDLPYDFEQPPALINLFHNWGELLCGVAHEQEMTGEATGQPRLASIHADTGQKTRKSA